MNKHNNLLSKIKVSSSADTTKLSLDEDTAYEIRELASDEVALHFDENYEPTEEGWILEHFIDKLALSTILCKCKRDSVISSLISEFCFQT